MAKQVFIMAVEADAALEGRILASIREEAVRSARRGLLAARLCTGFSGALAALSLAWLCLDAGQSGVLQPLSLLISDTADIASYWREFLSFVIETLPFASLCAFVASVAFVFFSLGLRERIRPAVPFSHA
jgi:hypothetical protein